MARPADDLQRDPLLHTAPSCEGFKVLEPAVLYAKVGAGGMGAVYRGRHFSLECDVAVKVLKPELAQDEQFVLRFAREARLSARISNDNVVRVLDVREKNGIHYLVMEFVAGETARARVRRKGPLAEAEALLILHGAAAGLREAHAQGIVHRDIKPDNVLIAADGRIKLADLGLAKAKTGSSDQSLTMLSSGVMGTPQYMPPEQWRTPDVTPAADVWSLGATLWFLLAGRSAIAAGELLVVAERIRDHDFPSLAELRPDVRPEVHVLLSRCTARDPANRFADASELLAALRPLLPPEATTDALRDAAAGSDNSLVATVTPPPRATLARIKLQVQQDGDNTTAVGAGGELPTMPQEPTGSAAAPAPEFHGAIRRARWPWAVAAVAGLGVAAAGEALGWWGRGGTAPAPASTATGARAIPAADAALPPAAASSEREPAVPGGAGGLPPTPPAGTAPIPAGEDGAAAARAALMRGRAALPSPDGLPAAIAAFEQALQLDPQLDDARASLILALTTLSRQLATRDPERAHAAALRALALEPGDAEAAAARGACEAVLRQRLQSATTWRAPAAGAVLGQRQVDVDGETSAPGARRVRAAVERPDAAAAFPADAAAALVVGGGFRATAAAPGDGPWRLRLQVEDERDLAIELPPRPIIVDLTPPVLAISAPPAGAVVGAEFEVRGTVADATSVAVCAGDVEATVDDAGRWCAVLRPAGGPQDVVVVATDAAGWTATVRLPVVVDREPPVLELDAEPPAATNQRAVALAGVVRDQGQAFLTIDGQPVDLGDDGRFAVSLPLRDGLQDVVLVAADALGNRAQRSFRVCVDTTPPVLAIEQPAADTVVAGPVEVSGTVSDSGACAVRIGGAAAQVADGRWRAVVQIAAGEVMTLAITARDEAGNDAEPLQLVLRGTAPPIVPAWAAPDPAAGWVTIAGLVHPRAVVESLTGMRFVLVPPGEFRMGSPPDELERGDDEVAHPRVIRGAFWLATTEVTQRQWRLVMGDAPSTVRGDELPVTNVSWNDAQQFLQQWNAAAGGGFRLPSEAEWEYACRAESRAAFAWGDLLTDAQANFDASQPYAGAPRGAKRGRPVAVASFPANALGLYDLHGNVFEWCQDTYAAYPAAGTETAREGDGPRVVRGGSFASRAGGCRSAFRFRLDPWTRNERTGLRVARSL